MASMLISGLIPLLQQPGLMLEMEEECQKLLNFFMITQDLLADAELRAEGDPNVRTWLVDLNTAAYDADDIVDDFRYVKLQAKAEAEGCRYQNGDRVRTGLFLFSCFKFSSINRSGALHGIENRIRSVMDRIDDLVERMRTLNFRLAAERPQQLIFSYPREIGDFFVGRDKEAEDIVELSLQYNLVKKTKLITIILGPQGIGKTALARFVCNDARIKHHFQCVLWVEVGSEFNFGKVAKLIIDQVIGKDCCISEGDTDLLELRLYQELTGKKYLVVLDDVRTGCEQLLVKFDEWRDMTHGWSSFLIVTTNFDEVVKTYKQYFAQFFARAIDVRALQPLMPQDGWNLFCKKAFSDDAKETRPEILEKMGKKIMGKCGGSPLALNMMGCLMSFKKKPEEWQGVINQLENYIGDGVATVETIIKVCYDNLCSQIKQCFAFCSIFPNGHYMDKEVLIKLWMANGLLLPSDRSMTPEEKGNMVFKELASRHFFEHVKPVHEDYLYRKKYGYHSRVTCKMLNCIHEQTIIAAREFALQIPYLLPISSDSRVDIPELLETNPNVRILLSPDDPFIRTINCSAVPKVNSLRGLHLHSALFERDLLELKYMRHLRYLDLSGSRIKTLPEVTSLLYFLQTLNLSKCLLLYQLPKNMKYMRNLRHLYIHKCPKLKQMPAHFRQLSNLQTLTTYIVGENAGIGIDEIKGLQLGGLLELYNLRKVKDAEIAKEADLVSKKNLDRLTLCWGSQQLIMSTENNNLGVLEALQPHIQLKVLKIQQYGGREFASWLGNPLAVGLVNLVELHLIGCYQCESLPSVWKLSSLKVLCLKHMARLTCISCTDEKDSLELFFLSLKRLVLVGLKRLERWNEGEAIVTFPVLDEVEITSCPNLKTMPCVPQLKHITASIENYMLLQSVIDLITQPESLVEEANIAKASSADNKPFPAFGAEMEQRVNFNLRKMRMDSTNSLFMPTTVSHSLFNLWRPFAYLEYLDIFNCNTLVFWPLEFKYLERLTRLSIRLCSNLTGMFAAPEGTHGSLLGMCRNLEFYGCSSLEIVPQCAGLRVLELDECPKVESIAGISRRQIYESELRGLEMLYLSCTSWTSLPSGLETVDRLTTLWVSECYSLTSLPDELAPIRVDTLVINECPMVKELPGGLEDMLSSLKKLQISKCPDLEKFCKEGPYSSIISQIGKRTDNSLSTN